MNADRTTRAAVVGAGTMGAGIAEELARVGYRVALIDVSEEKLEQGMTSIRRAQKALEDASVITSGQAGEALERVRPVLDLEAACSEADLVVEAVTENLEVKCGVFRRLDELSPEGAILASNTSGLSITAMSRATRRPQLVAGMHFWNPPHVMPLVEVIKGEETSEPTAECLVEVCRRLGKRPVLVQRDVPGFVGNRLQFAVMREALHLLSEGIASAEDIDTAMTAGPGLRYGLIGPLQTADLGGLDVFLAISSYLFKDLNSAVSPPSSLSELVNAGKHGTKTGQGFYEYTGDFLDRFISRRDRLLLEMNKLLGAEEAGSKEKG